MMRLNTDGYFSYKESFGDHSFDGVLGYSYFQINREIYGMDNSGFSVEELKMWDMGNGTWIKDGKADMWSTKDITQKLLAYFFRANYSYRYTYTLSATLRPEASSKFAVNNRWGLFWSLGASWRLSNEAFLQNVTWLNDLNIRVGYGVTGNEGFDADYAATMYGSDSWTLMPNGTWAQSYGITRNINPNLGWEERHEFNIGVDYTLFSNRLRGKFDIYNRNVKGLIYEVNVASPPYSSPTMHMNIGTLKSTGWELELGGDIVRNSDFSYSSFLNLTHNKVTMGKLWGNNTFYNGANTGWGGDAHRLQENMVVGQFHLWDFSHFEDGGFWIHDKDGNTVNGSIPANRNNEDKIYVGNYMPMLIAGWTHNLNYKNWYLGMTLTSRIKADVYNHVKHRIGFQSGANDINKLTAAYTTYGHVTQQIIANSYLLEDATFLKIQNLSLGYNVPIKQYVNLIDNMNIYFAANNLYTFTRYSGLNPEVNITGWDQGIEWYDVYPQTRSFTLGILLNF
jgi:hypothetical protein